MVMRNRRECTQTFGFINFLYETDLKDAIYVEKNIYMGMTLKLWNAEINNSNTGMYIWSFNKGLPNIKTTILLIAILLSSKLY